ncbi:NADH-quinone oxidoreductase subunit NuoE [Solitalea sp. MAHUQ-68]|uniref:NADH-quinone oxidoreductase subunit NuoE n=1 Tax=Solitalea agri TaxID=2953739 RepID=A0A9X2JD92_9SPHI|nr:NADH-quinone oxidoreductase subunit NuoE [Solitalea agri]MCO4292645.1 NADH-quinone oxidoreductase subunit NuoE [Solitalea agri]
MNDELQNISNSTFTGLSEQERNAIDHEVSLVPYPKAACIEAMKIVQKSRGWISDDALLAIAEYLNMSTAELDSVATFYNLIFRKPVGRHIILLCDSITCWVMGYKIIYQELYKQLNIQFGETTADKKFTLLPNACLGCCDHAPAILIDNDLYQDVKTEDISIILKNYN